MPESRYQGCEFIMTLNIKDLQNQWYELETEKINNEDPKKNKRKYLHFDFRLLDLNKENIDFVWKPDIVARHSFYPFINSSIIVRRKKKNNNGIRVLSKKERPIRYASHKDALLFSWYNYYLGQLYEEKIKQLGIDNSVIAYRSLKKSSIDFAKEVFDFIKKQKNCIVLCFDIHGFFDHLNHKIIKKQWKRILCLDDKLGLPDDHYAIYKAITKYSSIDLEIIKKIFNNSKGRFCKPEELREKISKTGLIKKNTDQLGIPQGSPISAVISNFYMLDFDIALNNYINQCHGLYKRYCDDIIVVLPFSDNDDPKEASNKSELFIKEEILRQKLEIQDEKTDKKIFKHNTEQLTCSTFDLKKSTIQYLGIRFDGINLDLRDSTWSRYHRRLSKLVALKTYKFLNGNNQSFPKKKIYEKFTDFGNNNLVSYAKNAERILGSELIKKKITKYRLIKNIKKKIKTETLKQKSKQHHASKSLPKTASNT